MNKANATVYAVTRVTNPELMAICYAQGWAAHEDYMTMEEAENVTANVGGIIQYNEDIKSLDELEYFPNMITEPYCFRNCPNLASIRLRNSNFNKKIIRQYFLYCYRLKTIDFGEHYEKFAAQTFTRCDSLETVVFRYDGVVSVSSSAWSTITDTLKNIVVPDAHVQEYNDSATFNSFNIIPLSEYSE